MINRNKNIRINLQIKKKDWSEEVKPDKQIALKEKIVLQGSVGNVAVKLELSSKEPEELRELILPVLKKEIEITIAKKDSTLDEFEGTEPAEPVEPVEPAPEVSEVPEVPEVKEAQAPEVQEVPETQEPELAQGLPQ